MQVDLEIGSFAGDMSLYLAPPPDESRLDSEQSTLLETSGSIFQSRERESQRRLCVVKIVSERKEEEEVDFTSDPLSVSSHFIICLFFFLSFHFFFVMICFILNYIKKEIEDLLHHKRQKLLIVALYIKTNGRRLLWYWTIGIKRTKQKCQKKTKRLVKIIEQLMILKIRE